MRNLKDRIQREDKTTKKLTKFKSQEFLFGRIEYSLRTLFKEKQVKAQLQSRTRNSFHVSNEKKLYIYSLAFIVCTIWCLLQVLEVIVDSPISHHPPLCSVLLTNSFSLVISYQLLSRSHIIMCHSTWPNFAQSGVENHYTLC